MNKEVLLNEKPWKAMLMFALPLMAANILQQLYNTVDTLVVGNFDSQTALSAVGSCAYIVMLYIALSGGLSLGAGVLASQAFGAKNEERLKELAGGGVILLLAVGVFSTGLSLATGSFFLRSLVRVPDSIYAQAILYLRVYSLGLVFQYGYNIIAAILRALGDSRSSMYFLIITSIVNIILDLLFVAVFGWGVAGVAWATVISQCISMIVSFLYMFFRFPFLRPDGRYWRWSGRIAGQVVRIGLPLALQQVITSCGFMMLQRLVNSFGEAMTAAYTVACRVEIYMLVPISAVTSAMATYTGQNLGAGQLERVRRGPRHARLLSLSLAVLVGIPCFLFAPVIVGWFGIHGKAVEFSVSQIRLVSADLLLYGFYQPLTGLYLGLSRAKVTMTMSMVEIGGRVLGGYLLSGLIGVSSCWWSEPFAWTGVIIFALVCYYRIDWNSLRSPD